MVGIFNCCFKGCYFVVEHSMRMPDASFYEASLLSFLEEGLLFVEKNTLTKNKLYPLLSYHILSSLFK